MHIARTVAGRWAMLMVAATVAVGAPANAQEPIDCGEYRGLVCEGLFTDEPDLVEDPTRVSDAIARVIETHGNPFAVVIASDARGEDPADFAADLANAWGVGDPVEENGILVLVAIDERRTEVVTQEGIDVPGRAIANAGRSFFAAGDFEGGVIAIVGAVDQVLSGSTIPGGLDGDTTGASWWLVGFLGLGAGTLGVGFVVSRRRSARRRERASRDRRIDGVLDLLEPRGDELAMARRYAITPPPDATAHTGPSVQALFDLSAGRAANADAATVRALARAGAVTLVDVDRMVEATRVPLELRAGDERSILESGLERAITVAKEVPLGDAAGFSVAMTELEEVARALRPHRIAAAQRRSADALVDRLSVTSAGRVAVEPLGDHLMAAAPVLDSEATILDSANDVAAARRIADEKVQRLTTIRARLSTSRTRDVAAVALADVDDDVSASADRFATVLADLRERGSSLQTDGISLPAVAALLLINNSDHDLGAFVEGYRTLRATHEPAIALEAAMAGLFTDAELRSVRSIADDLGVPIAIVVAIRERRDDGIEVYRRLLDDVAGTIGQLDAPVIAGILTVSLEPAVALDRWRAAKNALASLGLTGSYADVAAAFGASDPRGPRAFALAYAAQRSALEEAGFEELTRYAPELAHAGTSGQRDSWTGRPLSTRRLDFDPYTFFWLHWAATSGTRGSSSWGRLYRSDSWRAGGTGGWWGGGTGFGSSGGSSWGSSWGSSSGGGGFGGFGGGGGFGGSGGGGW